MKLFKKINPAILVCTLLIVQYGCGSEDKKKPEVSSSESHALPKIYVSTDLPEMSELSEGDTLKITVDETDEMYQLIVRKVQENIPGIQSISADIGNRESGLATLIFRDGRLSGFMDIYKSNKRWQIEYDDEKNAYYLNVIMPEDRDELEGGEPLTPPNKRMN